MNRPVLLFSGGLDSLALWYLLDRPRAVYVQLGHQYQVAEQQTIDRLSATVTGLSVELVRGPYLAHREDLRTGHIPHRNLALATTTAAVTGADRILLGALLGEASPDKSRRFLKATSAALTASEGRRITVEAPAHRLTKTGLVRKALSRYPEAALPLTMTRSCYSPDPTVQECGECPACFRRQVALFRTGLSDRAPELPVRFQSPLEAMAGAGVARWPGILANNLGAALAVMGRRPNRRY